MRGGGGIGRRRDGRWPCFGALTACLLMVAAASSWAGVTVIGSRLSATQITPGAKPLTVMDDRYGIMQNDPNWPGKFRLGAVNGRVTLGVDLRLLDVPGGDLGCDDLVWGELQPAHSPGGRELHAMAYDAWRSRSVLFGGVQGPPGQETYFGDTWEWDGSDWTNVTPQGPAINPPPRSAAALAYDGVRHQVVLFGGYNGTGYLQDTWVWDGSSWKEVTPPSPSPSPSARSGHAMAYDSKRGVVVLYGGSAGGAPIDDTWEWDGSRWTQTTSPGAGPNRSEIKLAYDEVKDEMVLFGGFDGSARHADTWVYKNNGAPPSWTQVQAASPPPAREGYGMARDDACGRIVLQGGYDGTGELDDVWEWDGSTWSPITPGGGGNDPRPGKRTSHGLVYDAHGGKMVIYGGAQAGTELADTWEGDRAYAIEVAMNVTHYEYSGGAFVPTTTPITLKVNYQPAPAQPYADRNVYSFAGAHALSVSITDIRHDGQLVAAVPAALFLEAGLEIERYDVIDPASTVRFTRVDSPSFKVTSGSGELELSWGVLPGAEEYDLEYYYVDDYDASGNPKSQSDVAYDFYHSGTRITTARTYHRLPLVYEEGYLVFRLRGVGRDPQDPDRRIEGAWSVPQTGTIASLVQLEQQVGGKDFFYIPSDGHESAFNWECDTDFAEEAKSKATVSYSDGSMRDRQEVTLLHPERLAMVGESIYDSQGRDAVDVLPAPYYPPPGSDPTPILRYYPGFDLNASGQPYSWTDFNVSGCGAATAPGAMSTSSGSSAYFSPLNPVRNRYQAYVPDAEGYPFVQTDFTPDRSGRIRSSGGAGKDHILGSGHELKYFYTQPFQEELDCLFGSEVGYAKHYHKVVFQNANGQLTNSYLDPGGRVIATALAGNPPLDGQGHPILEPLASYHPENLRVDLLNGGTATDIIKSTTANGLKAGAEFVVDSPGLYTFCYRMAAPPFRFTCGSQDFCFNPVFQLGLSVADDCGRQQVDFDPTKPGNESYSHTIGSISPDSLCGAPDDSIRWSSEVDLPAPFTANLEVGNYKIVKTLLLDPAALDDYAERYVKANHCLKTLRDFLDQEYKSLDTTSCDYTCLQCVRSLGDSTQYEPGEYRRLVEECMADCEPPDFCESSLDVLMGDVSPRGQYGEYPDSTAACPPHLEPLSVFTTGNQLPDRDSDAGPLVDHDWRHPYNPFVTVQNPSQRLQYFDSDGSTPSRILNAAGDSVAPNDPSISLKEFLANWRSSWARSLVYYHPEYCYYAWCKRNDQIVDHTLNRSSNGFDYLLLSTQRYSQADSLGLLALLNSPSLDPYFQSGGEGAQQYSEMSDALGNYAGSGLSMEDISTISVFCFSLYKASKQDLLTCVAQHAFGSGSNDQRNRAWQMFRSFYLGEKQRLQFEKKTEFAITNGCYNGCIGNAKFNPIQYGFFSAPFLNSEYWNQNQPCSVFTRSLYRSKEPRFPSPAQAFPFLNHDPYGSNVAGLMEDAKAYADRATFQLCQQCPLAFDLGLLLGALSDTLTSMVHLRDYPQLTGAVRDAMGATQPDVIWTPQPGSNPQHLQVDFTDPSGRTLCTLDLAFPPGQSHTWSDIDTLKALHFNPDPVLLPRVGNNNFTITAVMTDTTEVDLEGVTSCLEVGRCPPPRVCLPSAEALDLQLFLNTLIQQRQLIQDGHGVDLTVPPYDLIFTPLLRSELGSWQPPQPLVWWSRAVGSTLQGGIYRYPEDPPLCAVNLSAPDSLPISRIRTLSAVRPDTTGDGHDLLFDADSASAPILVRGRSCYPAGTCDSLKVQATRWENGGLSGPARTTHDLLLFLSALARRGVLVGTVSDLAQQFAEFTEELQSSLPAQFGVGQPGHHYEWRGQVDPNDSEHLIGTFVEKLGGEETEACTLSMEMLPGAGQGFSSITGFTKLAMDPGDPVEGTHQVFFLTAQLPGGQSTVVQASSCCFHLIELVDEECPDLASNGQFELDALGMDSNYHRVSGCPGPGQFAITQTASPCPGQIGRDHTTGWGRFMLLDPTLADTVISQQLFVQPGHDYELRLWAMQTSPQPGQQVKLKIYLDGDTLGDPIRLDSTLDPAGVWRGFQAEVPPQRTAGKSSFAFALVVSQAGTIRIGIDDLSFREDGCDDPLCNPAVFPKPRITSNPCVEYLKSVAAFNAGEKYRAYVDSVKNDFRSRYIAMYLGGAVSEKMCMSYLRSEHHYTLYYYGQDHNLERTVPPGECGRSRTRPRSRPSKPRGPIRRIRPFPRSSPPRDGHDVPVQLAG